MQTAQTAVSAQHVIVQPSTPRLRGVSVQLDVRVQPGTLAQPGAGMQVTPGHSQVQTPESKGSVSLVKGKFNHGQTARCGGSGGLVQLGALAMQSGPAQPVAPGQPELETKGQLGVAMQPKVGEQPGAKPGVMNGAWILKCSTLPSAVGSGHITRRSCSVSGAGAARCRVITKCAGTAYVWSGAASCYHIQCFSATGV